MWNINLPILPPGGSFVVYPSKLNVENRLEETQLSKQQFSSSLKTISLKGFLKMCLKDNEHFRMLTSVALLHIVMAAFEALLCEAWKPLRVTGFEPVSWSTHQTGEVSRFH